MKKIIMFLSVTLVAIFVSSSAFAAGPDAPGTKLITIQAGGFPGVGALISGQVALTDLAAGHLYGGLQLGGNFRHGAIASMGTRKVDLTLAPRLMLGWNLGRVVEFHAGGLVGVAAQRFNADKFQLVFCYGGFGGFRLNFSDSFGLVLEGCYSNCLPYATGGFAFRF